jgi:uncharacterized membrane protein
VSPTAWLIVRALHLVAVALFVGGQLMLVVAIVPALRAGDPDSLRRIAQRFGWASLAALAVLLATGAAMASRAGQWGSPTLHVKLGLVVAATVLVAWHIHHPTAHVVEVVVFVLSLAILYLGLALAHGPLPL